MFKNSKTNNLIRLVVLCLSLTFIACKENQPERKPIKQSSIIIAENPFKKVDSAVLSSGSLYRIDDFKSEFVSPRNIDIWLPDNYSSEKSYQVLLMHDGQMLFDSTSTWNKQEWGVDETLTRLMKTDSIKPTIVVSTWNVSEDRHSDYFPQKPFENLYDQVQQNLIEFNTSNSDRLFKKIPNSDDYLKFLVKEVIPLVENYYQISKQPQSYTVARFEYGRFDFVLRFM